jgi:hypothetical protein
MKPMAEKYQAATKVNALSSEIDNRRRGRQFARAGRQHEFVRKGEYKPLFRDLRQWHGIEGMASEPGRPCQIPKRKIRRQDEKYKEAEMFGRESDKLIVVKKQGNSCGAKGLALTCKEKGKHYPDSEQVK